MNNKMLFVWGFLVITIVVGILIYGMVYKKDHPYITLEREIKNATKEYMKKYEGIKPDEYIELTITSEELQKNKYLGELKYKNKNCSGKVIVTKTKRKYNYKPSIKCQ